MRKDLITFKPLYSTFLSCDKDIKKILQTLFVTSRPYSDILKKLLVINSKDCLSDNPDYQKVIDNMSLKDLIDKEYIRLCPKIYRGTHEQVKSYIIISLDNFSKDLSSDAYRKYYITFNVICNNDAWVLDDYKIRPLMICGYIEGILKSLTHSNTNGKSLKSDIKLTGIGQYQFIGCREITLNEDLSMYSLSFYGLQFSESIGQINNEQ